MTEDVMYISAKRGCRSVTQVAMQTCDDPKIL